MYRVNPETDVVQTIANTYGFIIGLTFDATEDYLYACDFQKHAIFRLPIGDDGAVDGDVETVLSESKKEPPIQPNYCVFDSTRRLYVSDSGDRAKPMDRSGGA